MVLEKSILIIILSSSELFANSIKDNLPDEIASQVKYLGSNWENEITSYDKIDLLIVDLDCNLPHLVEHRVRTIVNFNSIWKSGNSIAEEIQLIKPFKLVHLLKIIEKLKNRDDIFCVINHDFIYNELSSNGYLQQQSIKFTEQENKIFKFILLSPGFKTEKNVLLKKVWQYHENTESLTVDTHLYRLKAKLPKDMLKIKNNVCQLNIKSYKG